MFLSYSDYLEMVYSLLSGRYLSFRPKDRLIVNWIHIVSSYLLDSLANGSFRRMKYDIHVSFGRLRG